MGVVTRIKNLTQPGSNLSQKTIRGGFWVFALRGSERFVSLIRTIILARLLAPNDFGLMGIAMLALQALETFSQAGYKQALIYKQENIDDYLNTAWVFQVIRGLLLGLIMFASAPWISNFFNEPLAIPIIRVMAISEVLKGFVSIGVVIFQKELDFFKQFIFMFSGTLADLAVAIPCALILQNAWALVFGLLANNFVRFVISFFLHDFRPKLAFSLDKMKDMFNYGKWILAMSIIQFFSLHLDDTLVGRILGAASLGLYQLAYKVSNTVATEITHVISRVTFPAFSKVQTEKDKLKSGYFRTLLLIASINLPLTIVMIIIAPSFTRVVLGEQWVSMVPALQILFLAGMVRSLVATGGPLFKAVGEPYFDFKMNFWRFIVIVTTIYPFILLWGLEGAAISALLGIMATIPVWLKETIRITESNLRCYLDNLISPISGSIFVMFIVLLLSKIIMVDTLFGLVILSCIAFLAYLSFMYLFELIFKKGPWKIMKLIINELR